MTEANGLWHPQEGIVTGHFRAEGFERIQRVGHLRAGVAKVVTDPATRRPPDPTAYLRVSPTWSPAGASPRRCATTTTCTAATSPASLPSSRAGAPSAPPRRTTCRGWAPGSSASSTARAASSSPRASPEERVAELYAGRRGNQLVAPDLVPFEEVDARIWSAGASIFLPCAASRLVTRPQVDALLAGGLEVVSCGANVPFADDEIFYGSTYEHADRHVP
jgi:hypothetical protein